MKLLTTATGRYLTGTAIADAVVHFGVALANEFRVGAIEIPFVASDGQQRRALLTVGWHAAASAEEHDGHGGELHEPELVRTLEQRMRGVRPNGNGFLTGDELVAVTDYDVL